MIGRQMRGCGEIVGRMFETIGDNGHVVRCEVMHSPTRVRFIQYGSEVAEPKNCPELEAFIQQATRWADKVSKRS